MKNKFKFALLLCSSLLLQTVVTEAMAKKTEPATPPEDNAVVSVAVADWNQDQFFDSAVLVRSGDGADLYVYLRNADNDMELKLYKKNLVWSGALEGTKPYLKSQAKNGLLFIYAENDAIGRDRWHQRLTVDYKDNAFVVTALSYDSVDTLKPEAGISCEIDFATGSATKNKKPFKVEPRKVALADWADSFVPKSCKE
jgi:hypothetical protein